MWHILTHVEEAQPQLEVDTNQNGDQTQVPLHVDTKQVEEVDKCTQMQVLVQVDIKQEVELPVVTKLQELLELHKQI